MEEQTCQHLAAQEWAETNGQDREQLRAAGARIQILSDVQVNKQAAEEAQRRLAISEAEKQAIAQRMEHEKIVAVEDAHKLIQHAEANAASAADEANRRLAQEENENLRM
eukprot:9311155-Pyramimonas_sp.AAC.1